MAHLKGFVLEAMLAEGSWDSLVLRKGLRFRV